MRVQKKASRAIWLSQKYLLQFCRGRDLKSRPLFVIGCQRSGTNMLLQVLDKSLDTWIYRANNRRAFDKRRIKPAAEVRRLIDGARCRWLVFKPLSDTQNIDRLLADHPDGKAIWIFRQYQDAANSAVRSWGEWQRAHIRRAATKPDWQHWLVERMSDKHRQLVKRLYGQEMSVHSAAVLKWYLRNQIYFDYSLDHRPDRVWLVRYEDLVFEPLQRFKDLFEFLNIEFKPSFVSGVYNTSVGKDKFPKIDPVIESLCDELMRQFQATLEKQLQWRLADQQSRYVTV